MSKRFGRNQKRKLQAEIERLEQELRLAITGGFSPAKGRYGNLDEFVSVYLEADVREIEDAFTIRREATIRFVPRDRRATKIMTLQSAYSGLVEWRGIVWQLCMRHRAEISPAFYDAEVVEFDLRAIGDRDSRRKPFSMPECVIGSTITRNFNPDRIAA